jgi:hypothetical protein
VRGLLLSFEPRNYTTDGLVSTACLFKVILTHRIGVAKVDTPIVVVELHQTREGGRHNSIFGVNPMESLCFFLVRSCVREQAQVFIFW